MAAEFHIQAHTPLNHPSLQHYFLNVWGHHFTEEDIRSLAVHPNLFTKTPPAGLLARIRTLSELLNQVIQQEYPTGSHTVGQLVAVCRALSLNNLAAEIEASFSFPWTNADELFM